VLQIQKAVVVVWEVLCGGMDLLGGLLLLKVRLGGHLVHNFNRGLSVGLFCDLSTASYNWREGQKVLTIKALPLKETFEPVAQVGYLLFPVMAASETAFAATTAGLSASI
jgi:hypothetical protein